MIVEESKTPYKGGKVVGYLFSYFVFTTILFFALTLLKKMPSSWTFFHIMGITLFIAILGGILKKLLR